MYDEDCIVNYVDLLFKIRMPFKDMFKSIKDEFPELSNEAIYMYLVRHGL